MFNKRYSSQSQLINDFVVVFPEIIYDKVVDKSKFVPDKEHVRIKSLSGSGSVSTPVYDTDPDKVSRLEVKLRSGKLDKGEVSQLLQKEECDLKNLANERDKKAKREKLEKTIEARQEFLDKQTGFSGQTIE